MANGIPKQLLIDVFGKQEGTRNLLMDTLLEELSENM